jgi:hypothetical protein
MQNENPLYRVLNYVIFVLVYVFLKEILENQFQDLHKIYSNLLSIALTLLISPNIKSSGVNRGERTHFFLGFIKVYSFKKETFP